MTAIYLWVALVGQTPDVQATLLSGETYSGNLVRVDTAGATLLQLDGAEVNLPTSELQELRVSSAVEPADLNEIPLVAGLSDGSLLVATQLASDGSRLTLETAHGAVEVPAASVQSLRFSPVETGQLDAWNDLLGRESQNDLIVILKDGVLDFVGGVVGAVDAEKIAVIVNNQELELPRERVFGIIYAGRAPARQSPICEITLSSGEKLRAVDLVWEAEQIIVSLTVGAELRISVADASLLDFGLGKIRYLSDLNEQELEATYEPVGIQSPGSPLTFPIRVNRRLVLGGDRNACDRSIWVHSGTKLEIRANRDFRRLEMTTGIVQESFTAHNEPRVILRVTGDGETLFEETIAWNDSARELQLDVTDMRIVEIEVLQSEPTLGSCEHLGLGEARLVK